jgi:predicted DNA-binding protein
VKESKITKTVKLDIALNEAVENASRRLGEHHSTIIRMAIRAGLPIVERHHLAMTESSETYPLTEVTALRAAETPKKSSAQ